LSSRIVCAGCAVLVRPGPRVAGAAARAARPRRRPRAHQPSRGGAVGPRRGVRAASDDLVRELAMTWFDLCGALHERTFAHGAGLSSLSNEWERELAALWRLEADVNNGAYLQFLANW